MIVLEIFQFNWCFDKIYSKLNYNIAPYVYTKDTSRYVRLLSSTNRGKGINKRKKKKIKR